MRITTLAEATEFRKEYPGMIQRRDYGDLILFNYSYKDPSLFTIDSPLRDLRGVVYTPEGEVASLPLRTFFNVFEVPRVQLDYEGYYGEKLDGSMLQVSHHDGRTIVGSRHSLEGYVAQEAPVCGELEEYVAAFPDYTFIFEFLDPGNTIVIQQERKELVFLVARNKLTGEYSHEFSPPNTTVNKLYPLNLEIWERMRAGLDQDPTTEGVVFWSNGEFWKYKTPWYVDAHRYTTDFTDAKVLAAWADHSLDDVLDIFHRYNRRDLIDRTHEAVGSFTDLLDQTLERMLSQASTARSAKEAALGLTRETQLDNIVFGTVMEMYRASDLGNVGFARERVREKLTPSKLKRILEDG